MSPVDCRFQNRDFQHRHYRFFLILAVSILTFTYEESGLKVAQVVAGLPTNIPHPE